MLDSLRETKPQRVEIRWCRCARPPAMGCDPSGVRTRRRPIMRGVVRGAEDNADFSNDPVHPSGSRRKRSQHQTRTRTGDERERDQDGHDGDSQNGTAVDFGSMLDECLQDRRVPRWVELEVAPRAVGCSRFKVPEAARAQRLKERRADRLGQHDDSYSRISTAAVAIDSPVGMGLENHTTNVR
jgi:hypothetical protein